MYPLLEDQGRLTDKRMQVNDPLLKEIYIEALIRRNIFKMEDGRDLWQASNKELHVKLFELFDKEGME
ncbi:Fur-regulated basic protein FbpA [Bacillus clarus]|nr:Fur-regulated basic protein FbpA [Bacillus clarus]